MDRDVRFVLDENSMDVARWLLCPVIENDIAEEDLEGNAVCVWKDFGVVEHSQSKMTELSTGWYVHICWKTVSGDFDCP